MSEIKSINSSLGFGGAAISGEGGGYGFGPISESESMALLRAVLDLGIKLFDTAPIYGFGLSEKRMGKAFKTKREQIVLASKGGVTWNEQKRVDIDNRPEIIGKMFEQSLRDLQTDYIDIYMIHWPDSRTDIRFALEYLLRRQEEKKIIHLGLCNTNLEDLQKAEQLGAKIAFVQNELNCFNQQVVHDLFPYLAEKKIDFMSWGTLDKGILSGKVRSNEQKFAKEDARSWAPWWKKERALRERKFSFVKKAEEAEYDLLSLALAHNLQFAPVKYLLCGGRNLKQWQELVVAFGKAQTMIYPQELNFDQN